MHAERTYPNLLPSEMDVLEALLDEKEHNTFEIPGINHGASSAYYFLNALVGNNFLTVRKETMQERVDRLAQEAVRPTLKATARVSGSDYCHICRLTKLGVEFYNEQLSLPAGVVLGRLHHTPNTHLVMERLVNAGTTAKQTVELGVGMPYGSVATVCAKLTKRGWVGRITEPSKGPGTNHEAYAYTLKGHAVPFAKRFVQLGSLRHYPSVIFQSKLPKE